MVTRIEQIRAAVDTHFTMKDMADAEYKMAMEDGWKDHTFRQYFIDEHAKQHAAMTMLRDLLPLLEASVKWHQQGDDTSFDESVMICDELGGEVAKLLEEATD